MPTGKLRLLTLPFCVLGWFFGLELEPVCGLVVWDRRMRLSLKNQFREIAVWVFAGFSRWIITDNIPKLLGARFRWKTFLHPETNPIPAPGWRSG